MGHGARRSRHQINPVDSALINYFFSATNQPTICAMWLKLDCFYTFEKFILYLSGFIMIPCSENHECHKKCWSKNSETYIYVVVVVVVVVLRVLFKK
jgi:hypothetical protein